MISHCHSPLDAMSVRQCGILQLTSELVHDVQYIARNNGVVFQNMLPSLGLGADLQPISQLERSAH